MNAPTVLHAVPKRNGARFFIYSTNMSALTGTKTSYHNYIKVTIFFWGD
jgi:hypothetical protein